MGCFAVTDELTQDLFKMGIPVWLIRAKASPYMPEAKLLYATDPTPPRGIVSEFAPGHSVVFEGVAWSKDYLGQLHDWARYIPLIGSIGETGAVSAPTQSVHSVGGSTSKRRKRGKDDKDHAQQSVKRARTNAVAGKSRMHSNS
jgi:hypothetical protein